MTDLFEAAAAKKPKRGSGYSAKDIEVLEGLEPVRRRPGMYIGGTDEKAMHHLLAEVLDNSMDEAVAGHASRIEIDLARDGSVTVKDNGRGIPVDPHPKFKNKSALEVILTTLHSGGKFNDKVYATSGGLHGVGISVVNALSEKLRVEVARDRKLFTQDYSRGKPKSKLTEAKAPANRRGTLMTFTPDKKIFGDAARFNPAQLYRMARSKAYLFRGVEIRWSCDEKLLGAKDAPPAKDTLHFPGGLEDFLEATLGARGTLTTKAFSGRAANGNEADKVEWAISWPEDEDGFVNSYCNTIPTPQGGSHESALRTALARGLKNYGSLTGEKKIGRITADDLLGGACIMLSVFIRDPQFQGQTKDKLSSPEAAKLVEGILRDHFEIWLSADPEGVKDLIERALERAEERQRRRTSKDLARKSATRKLRLPGKLADCTQSTSEGTELFMVEGDSAGGSAKQARDRATQAVLPLRGKILNVASASADKLNQNQELTDLIQALGCGTRADFDIEKLRYERVIIMTDADVDGAHIASLLMTFFYREMPGLVQEGRLFLAQPPLYRLGQGNKTFFARDDKHKDALLKSEFKANAKVDVSRFKGLGEMPPGQLKETTMDPSSRTLLQVAVPAGDDKPAQRKTARLVESLMGRKAEKRYQYIQDNAEFAGELDI
ncbi:MAG TPA: DNA topoisomerase IV subunit B [Rhodospirillaceae bacterium]|nr:DNA topoisomerase IV subunit B [Rhodospirillaceae bacterium]HAT35221.1 DNA topoisomerase IV subunit B [Rhodospirillaceae bacterium]